MNAIGLIETKGLIPSIEAADVMLKTSNVQLLERAFVGGGLVTITVTGDVAAVKAAVDAGAMAVLTFGEEQLLSRHVIPRPHAEVGEVLFPKPVETVSSPVETKQVELLAADLADELPSKQPKAAELSAMPVAELRKLAAQYENLGMTEKALAMANRATLLKRLKERLPEA